MTKTLTDEWRAGNLKKSFYYLKFPDTETAEIYNLYDMEKFRYVQDSEKIDVLDEVPSYEEYNDLIQQNVNQESAIETYIERIHELEEQIPNGTWFTQKSHNELLNKIEQLEKRLEIATKALKDIVKDYNINGPCEEDCVGDYMCGTSKQALKEMEALKK